MMPEARNVGVRLGGRSVLEAVSCTAQPGAITAVIGPNGAGKSTLLRALAGVAAPQAGEVLLDGRPLAAFTPAERGQAIAYLPQDRIVHWPLSVRTIVGLGRLPWRRAPAGEGAADQAAIEAAMIAMDVMQLQNRPAGALSGGERARVLMARALAQTTPVVVADEPTAGLDPAHQLALFACLDRLATQAHTIIVALHDLSLAARFCKRIILLSNGRVAAQGPSAEVLTPERLGPVYGVQIRCDTLAGIPVVLPLAPLP